ncbi:MAG TPA: hypothetical protein VGP93_20680, partial [Polyangiaceae bacterium]|nr:hypothetical protein [Polyangiaceae bacterium]
MALLDSEVARCKAELGYPLIGQANPYIGVTLLFEQVIQPYLGAGATTTSSTSVTGDGAPFAIVLSVATGFAAGARVVVDVDGRQEKVTVQSLSGSSLTALFTKAHTGTYPVTVEGGESLVREKLGEIWSARVTRGKSQGRGALKAIVGDVEWYDSGMTSFASSSAEIDVLRDELAAILGIENLWRR